MKANRVLIVDDVPENLQILGNMLASERLDLSFATSGEQALLSCMKQKPDLILLDVLMPDLDGFEVCRRLKSAERTADISVIFLTAKSDDSSISAGFEIGGADYLTKPFLRGELIARVRSRLELKRTRDDLVARNQSLLELNGALHRLLSVVSHDLKGPIGSVHAIVEHRRRNPNLIEDPVERRKFLDLVAQSLEKSKELLEQLLAWARLQSDEIYLRKSCVSIKALLEDEVRILQPIFDSKDVRIVHDGSDAAAMADREMIRTVLRNLLSNAAKFSYPGSAVHTSVFLKDGFICVRIRDFGVGISMEQLSGLFRPDRRISTPGTNEEKGSGFGLILCKEFVSRNGGNLTLAGRPGEGVTVEFTLVPYKEPECV